MSAVDPEVERKVSVGKQKKEVGDQAFRAGDVTNALRAYHEALMYLHGISKNMPGAVPGPMGAAPVDTAGEAKPKTEVDEMLEKIHSNMAACQIKKGNWKRAVECADQALAKNDKNTKALFRKGKALGELGFFEKSEKILSDLLNLDLTEGPAIKAELERLRAKDKEREKQHNQKFKGFLNREKGTKGESSKSGSETPDDPSKRFEWVDEPADEVSDD